MFSEKGKGEKWERVYQGEFSSYYPSHSEAVAAIIHKLRYYSGNDRSQVRSLLDLSGLRCENWDQGRWRSTWIDGEIDRIFARGGRVFERNRSTPVPPFAQVPSWVIQEATSAAGRVYCALALYANKNTWEATPAAGTIAQFLNLSRSRVFEAFRVLEDIGAIERLKRFGTSNRYRLPMERSEQTWLENGTTSLAGRRARVISETGPHLSGNPSRELDHKHSISTNTVNGHRERGTA